MADSVPNKFERILTEGVLIAVATGYVYLATFAYELGYCNHFGIPREFINLSLSNILIAAVAVGVFFLTSVQFLGFTVPFLQAGANPTEAQKPYRNVFLLNGVLLICGVLIWHAYASWKSVLVVVALAAIYNFAYFGIGVLFSRGKPLRERFEAIDSERDPFDMWGLLMDRFGRKSVRLFLTAMIPITSAYFIGNGNAYRQERFFVLKDSPDYVLLRNYGDLMITARVDRSTKVAGDELLILRISSKDRIELRAEEFGPLRRQAEAVVREKKQRTPKSPATESPKPSPKVLKDAPRPAPS